jgi:hypothetical protein
MVMPKNAVGDGVGGTVGDVVDVGGQVKGLGTGVGRIEGAGVGENEGTAGLVYSFTSSTAMSLV